MLVIKSPAKVFRVEAIQGYRCHNEAGIYIWRFWYKLLCIMQ